MDVSFEIEVMRLFDGALAQPESVRQDWLAAQPGAPSVLARVRELLASDAAAARFLERPPTDAASAALARLPAAGDRVGAWELLRPLDAGGMGIVFLARRADGAYEQHAAIKFIRGEHLLDARLRDEVLRRFANERRLLARLEHPNVARVLDGGSSDDGWPYLAMEYVDGVALDAWCERNRLALPARVDLMRKVCDAVQAAHRHLVVHRDLKPQNVLVDAAGEPRLLDFGIARVLDAASAGGSHTAVLALTPAYASPEQMRGEPATTASDVYSLGVILYELLSGARPHKLEGLSLAQSERVVGNTQPLALRRAIESAGMPQAERRARLAQADSDLERIVALALHKDPARRYASAAALEEDLARWREGRPVLAHPDSAGYRFARFVRRHRVGSAAAALALIAVLGAGAVALAQAQQARRAAADLGQINAFLLDVLKISNPYATGSEISLGEALDEAAGKVDERFGDRPDLAVDLRNALGESMFARYRLEQAEAQLLRARADGERVFGEDDARTVFAISTLASVRKDQDRVDEARTLFDEALRRLERSGQQGNPLYAAILNDIGVMYLVQEDFARARSYLQRAADSDRGGGDRAAKEERARTLANLAQAARGLGELDRADALYRQAQPVLESLYPQGGPHLAVILNNRARLAMARGRKDEAVELQKQAVAMHQRSFAGDHVMILVPMTNLARMALDTGQTQVAAGWAEKAAAMADRLYPEKSHHYQVNALAALTAARLAQGREADARTLLRRANGLLAGLDNAPASTRDYLAGLSAKLCADGTAACGLPAQAEISVR